MSAVTIDSNLDKVEALRGASLELVRVTKQVRETKARYDESLNQLRKAREAYASAESSFRSACDPLGDDVEYDR
jgi:lipoate synthase